MQRYTDVVLQAPGAQPLVGASVQVNTFPGGVPATIYVDNGVTLQGNPITTDGNGRFAFYAADGHYSIVITKAGYTTQTIADILLEDLADPNAGNFTNATVSGTLALAGATVTGTPTWPSTQAMSISGNAATATAAGTATLAAAAVVLATPRTINGVSFDGSANITVTAAAGTLTGNTLAGVVTASSLTSVGTLTSLTMGGTLTMGANTLALASTTVSGAPTWSSNQAITLSTAAQPNVTSVGTLTALTISGALTMTAAASQLIPGATSFSHRNNANNADNLLISDAGAVTIRSSAAWGTGVANFGTVTKRKTADETVTSSTALQDDDHLSFSIAANEEWVGFVDYTFGDNLGTTGVKLTMTAPAAASARLHAVIVTSIQTVDALSATAPGNSMDFGVAILGAATIGNVRIGFWVLNSSTAGSVTVQWAQSTNSGTALKAYKGSWLQATRVA